MDHLELWKKVVKFLEEKDFPGQTPGLSADAWQEFCQRIDRGLTASLRKKAASASAPLPDDLPKKAKLFIHSDGGARGNPGPAGIGVVIYDGKGKILWKGSQYLGETTNNCAEYEAFLWAVRQALALSPSHVVFKMDSELVARQLNGIYKVKNPQLQQLHETAKKLLSGLPSYEVCHILREENQEADRMANHGMDSKS